MIVKGIDEKKIYICMYHGSFCLNKNYVPKKQQFDLSPTTKIWYICTQLRNHYTFHCSKFLAHLDTYTVWIAHREIHK